MSELDFDRSLPPIMPSHGDFFNQQVAELVEQADGDEQWLREALVVVPRQRDSERGIPLIEYPIARPALDRFVVVSKPGEHEVRGAGGRQMGLKLGRHKTSTGEEK